MNGSKRHSLQAVYLSQRIQTAVQIVSKPPAPRNGGRFTFFYFKWSRYTLTTLNISQLQTCIYLLETAHSRTTKQLTRAYITNIPHSVLTRDGNAHSTLRHSYTDYHRGQRIEGIISNSDHIPLNPYTPTSLPNTTLQQT